jgi:hypothetical protein
VLLYSEISNATDKSHMETLLLHTRRECIASRTCPEKIPKPPGGRAFLAIPISLRQSAPCRLSRRVPRAFVQPYNCAQTYELISQFRLISSNCGVVHSMVFPPFTRCLGLPIPTSSLQNSDKRTRDPELCTTEFASCSVLKRLLQIAKSKGPPRLRKVTVNPNGCQVEM